MYVKSKSNNKQFGTKLNNTHVYDKMESMSRALTQNVAPTSQFNVLEEKYAGTYLPPTQVEPVKCPATDVSAFVSAKIPKYRNYGFNIRNLTGAGLAAIFIVQLAEGIRLIKSDASEYNDTDDAHLGLIKSASPADHSPVSIALANLAFDAKNAIIARSDSINPFYTTRISEIYDMMTRCVYGQAEAAAFISGIKQLYELEDYIKLGMPDIYNSPIFSNIFGSRKFDIQSELVRAESALIGKLTVPSIHNAIVEMTHVGPTPVKQQGALRLLVPRFVGIALPLETSIAAIYRTAVGSGTATVEQIIAALKSISAFMSSPLVQTVNAALSPFTLMSQINGVGAPGFRPNATLIAALYSMKSVRSLNVNCNAPIIQMIPVYGATNGYYYYTMKMGILTGAGSPMDSFGKHAKSSLTVFGNYISEYRASREGNALGEAYYSKIGDDFTSSENMDGSIRSGLFGFGIPTSHTSDICGIYVSLPKGEPGIIMNTVKAGDFKVVASRRYEVPSNEVIAALSASSASAITTVGSVTAEFNMEFTSNPSNGCHTGMQYAPVLPIKMLDGEYSVPFEYYVYSANGATIADGPIPVGEASQVLAVNGLPSGSAALVLATSINADGFVDDSQIQLSIASFMSNQQVTCPADVNVNAMVTNALNNIVGKYYITND